MDQSIKRASWFSLRYPFRACLNIQIQAIQVVPKPMLFNIYEFNEYV